VGVLFAKDEDDLSLVGQVAVLHLEQGIVGFPFTESRGVYAGVRLATIF
jgi:hypothetical protein